MKVHAAPPLLSLRLTDLVDLEDLTVILETGDFGYQTAQLIVRAGSRTWNAPMYCGTQDPVTYLSTMSPARLRDDLEYSRPAAIHDAPMVKRMTYDMAQVIPHAVQIHASSLQPAPAKKDTP